MTDRDQIVSEVHRRMKSIIGSEDAQDVMRELWGNVTQQPFEDPETSERGGLEWYGINKVARVIALIAVCQENNIPLDVMRMTDAEITEQQLQLAQAFVEGGKPVFIVGVGGDDDSGETEVRE